MTIARKILFTLIACAGVAAAPCMVATPAMAQEAIYTDSVTGLGFPLTIAKMTRGDTQDFESKMPGMGTSVAYYAADKAKAHIYIYNMKLKGIPDGPDSSMVEDELKRSAGEITAMEDKGYYSNVKELDFGTATMGKEGAPRIRYKKFSFRIKDGTTHMSYLLMSGYKGNFFKIRYSYPAELGEDGDKDALRFIAGMGKVIEAGSSTSNSAPKTETPAEQPKKMKLER